jgi:aryl-alcohol dehydrogenase-like predicted oxidoreductase
VVITIRLDRRPDDRQARALGIGAIVALLHPLLASLAMLLPVLDPAQGVALLVLAPVCRSLGVGVTAYGVLSRGLLSGH